MPAVKVRVAAVIARKTLAVTRVLSPVFVVVLMLSLIVLLVMALIVVLFRRMVLMIAA